MHNYNHEERIVKYLSIFACSLLLVVTQAAYARTVAGVNLDDSITVAGSQQPLLLNGAGIRSKFIFEIYVGALYLEQKQSDVSKILAANGSNRVSMHFLYKEVEKEKLTDAWTEGFRKNNDDKTFAALEERLKKFNTMFETARKGDLIILEYNPASGTRVNIKGQDRGTISGADFNRALLKVWLGDYPADSGLKSGMLGEND